MSQAISPSVVSVVSAESLAEEFWETEMHSEQDYLEALKYAVKVLGEGWERRKGTKVTFRGLKVGVNAAHEVDYGNCVVMGEERWNSVYIPMKHILLLLGEPIDSPFEQFVSLLQKRGFYFRCVPKGNGIDGHLTYVVSMP